MSAEVLVFRFLAMGITAHPYGFQNEIDTSDKELAEIPIAQTCKAITQLGVTTG